MSTMPYAVVLTLTVMRSAYEACASLKTVRRMVAAECDYCCHSAVVCGRWAEIHRVFPKVYLEGTDRTCMCSGRFAARPTPPYALLMAAAVNCCRCACWALVRPPPPPPGVPKFSCCAASAAGTWRRRRSKSTEERVLVDAGEVRVWACFEV